MVFDFRFAYIWILYSGFLFLTIGVLYRFFYYKSPLYIYPVTHLLSSKSFYFFPYKKILAILRFFTLVGLLLLSSRPQLIDKQSKVIVQGIDIMLVLDVSGSMQLFDDLTTQLPRIAVAKQEAIKFIKKRDNDPMGLVIFGKDAITRVPLTLDKKLLESIIDQTNLGDVDPQGTVLCKSLLMAINRLKNSTAKSRVIIVLTDGEPTQEDVQPDLVIQLAKKFNIKIHTIGIGSSDGGYCQTPFGIQAFNIPFNPNILSFLSKETGGKTFLATRQKELENIYQEINNLEKTEHESNIFHRYEDIIMPYIWIIIILLLSEIVLSQTIWFGL